MMATYRVTPSFNRGLSPSPNFLSEPPRSPVSPPPKPCISPYLRPVAASGHVVDDAELCIFDAERYFRDASGADPLHHGAVGLPELFSGQSSDVSTDPRDSSTLSQDWRGRHRRNAPIRSFSTPTTSSEASWNSRSGLLPTLPDPVVVKVKDWPPSEQKRASSFAGRRRFGRNCPCAGKKSVEVEKSCFEPKSSIRPKLENSNSSFGDKKQRPATTEAALSRIAEVEASALEEIEKPLEMQEITMVKITPGNWAKGDAFFNGSTVFSPQNPSLGMEIGPQIVNSGGAFNDPGGFSFPIIIPPNTTNSSEEPPRDSLEVFRPAEETTSFRKLAELRSRSFTCKASATEEEAASDASSDLFELESCSTSYPLYRLRDSLDEFQPRTVAGVGGGGVLRRSFEEAAPRECYPPSEASVVWSVTTEEGFDLASAANFSSAASDCGELQLAAAMEAGRASGSRRKGGGGSLLSCRGGKAVSVGPNPVRLNQEPLGPLYMSGPEGGPRLVRIRSNDTVQCHPGRLYLPVRAR